MKIGEAQKAYRQQISLLRGQKRDFVKQREENRKKLEEARKKSEEQGVIFEFSEAYLEREKELQEKSTSFPARSIKTRRRSTN